jgi:hypothetical protein
VKKKIQAYISAKQMKLPIEKVPASKEEAFKLELPQLLLQFTDEARINRAETIRETSFSFLRTTPQLVKASVKNYIVEIDIANKAIRHDCEDWRKKAPNKEFCKHVVRVFLSLPLKTSKEILAEMMREKDLWRFELLPENAP